MPSQLRRDAALGTALPEFATTAATYNASIALAEQMVRWNPINDTAAWDGFALLVDDVERYAGPALNFSLAALQAGIPHFFRLAVSVLSPNLASLSRWQPPADMSLCPAVHQRRPGGRLYDACDALAQWHMGRPAFWTFITLALFLLQMFRQWTRVSIYTGLYVLTGI